MIRRVAIGAVVASALLAACETPPLRVRYRVASEGAQSCGATSCADVALPCPAVLNVRILDPDDPSAPFISVCEPIPMERGDVCAISQMNLAEMAFELPKQTLEVQMLIWPRDAVEDANGQLDCRRIPVVFDARDGFPISQHPAPALGGHAFYQPGDAETVVTLGCTALETLNTCAPEETIAVAATVEDFDNPGVSVGMAVGDQLYVDIGEPRGRLVGTETVYELNPGDTRPLEFTVVGVVPAWSGDIDLEIDEAACLQVLESGAQTTTAVTCRAFATPPVDAFDMVGYLLPRATLQQILGALELSAFPDRGLTVGIVLDAGFNRAAGKTVTASTPSGASATLEYLSVDLGTVTGTATSASGVFVSRDAPFGTTFGVAGSPIPVAPLGGLIEDKVTIVFLQLPPDA